MTRHDDRDRPEDLTARRAKLAETLASKMPADKATASKRQAGWAEATKIASEFVAGIIVGAGIGWFFDRGLGTKPFGLIGFLLLGFGAGVLNVLRAQGVVAEPGQQLRDKAARPAPRGLDEDPPDGGSR
jgi:ATP synthase protein I